ncbi:MAG: hypothetical protein E6J14_14555 [Chloroflexi bacterium]|nr:MAG: hypothetical protein E6J14_14555 [Chloroflexota bacterium]
MRRAFLLFLAALAALQLTGCEQYLFRQSDRIRVVSPQTYSTVREPLTIRWQARDFTPPRDGSFAVFVDRDPMPPGESLDYFSRDDRDRIHVLDQTWLHIDVLSPQVGVDPAEQHHHDVTIVLLDSRGARIGEYAGFTEFNVVRGP